MPPLQWAHGLHSVKWRKESGYSPTGVCLPPCPLWNDRQRLASVTGRRLKWSVWCTFPPEFDWIDVRLFWAPLSPAAASLSNVWVRFHRLENSFPFFLVQSSYSLSSKNTADQKKLFILKFVSSGSSPAGSKCNKVTRSLCDMRQCFWLSSELLYNLTADVEKRQRSQPSRAYFTQNGSQISQVSQQLRLDINKEQCRRYTAYVKVGGTFLLPAVPVAPRSSLSWPRSLGRRNVDVRSHAVFLCYLFV